MSIYNYTCEHCGTEKHIILEEGERLEDKICGCFSSKAHTSDYFAISEGIITKMHKHEENSHACGCGGNCDCN